MSQQAAGHHVFVLCSLETSPVGLREVLVCEWVFVGARSGNCGQIYSWKAVGHAGLRLCRAAGQEPSPPPPPSQRQQLSVSNCDLP